MGELVRLAREALVQQRGLDPVPKKMEQAPLPQTKPVVPLHPGSLVTWGRADGSKPIGFVDVLHMDPDGKQWAFVSCGKTWAAVDRRLLTVVTP